MKTTNLKLIKQADTYMNKAQKNLNDACFHMESAAYAMIDVILPRENLPFLDKKLNQAKREFKLYQNYCNMSLDVMKRKTYSLTEVFSAFFQKWPTMKSIFLN